MNKKKAFTLIELLVVIAIIALLLSILMPSLSKAKQQARTVLCKSNLKQWHLVFSMYTQENNDRFHGGWGSNVEDSGNDWWVTAALNYVEDVDELRCCPTATKVQKLKDGGRGPGTGKEPFTAWGYQNFSFSDDTTNFAYGSYGFNAWLCDQSAAVTASNGHFFAEKFWRNILKIDTPSNVPMLTDSRWVDGWPNSDDYPPTSIDETAGPYGASQMARFIQDRHGKRQDMLFADGVVETIGLKKMWTLKWHRTYDTKGTWTLAGGVTSEMWAIVGAEWMADYKDY